MTDAPKRIIARMDHDGEIDGQWLDADAPRPHSFGHYFTEYTRADLIDMDVLERVEAALVFATKGHVFVCGSLTLQGGTVTQIPCGCSLCAALADLRAMMEKLK